MSVKNLQHADFFSICKTLFCVISFEGYFKQINMSWQTILGYESDNLLDSQFLELIHPDDQIISKTYMDQLSSDSGDPIIFTNRIKQHDGTYREFLWQATPVMAESAFYAVGIDTTAYKNETQQTISTTLKEENVVLRERYADAQMMLEELQQEQEIYQIILDKIQEGIVLQNEKGRITTLNKQAKTILGSTLQLHDFNKIWQMATVSAEINFPKTDTAAKLVVDTQIIPSHHGVQFNKKIIILQDVTKQRQTENSLQQLKDDFELATQNKREGVLDWDLRTDNVTYSPRWKNLLGCQIEEIVGNKIDTWYAHIHPSDNVQVIKEVNNCLRGKARLFENIHRLQHKDGSYRWVHSQGTILRDKVGQAHRLMISFIDITERKRAEEAIEASEKYSKLFNAHTDPILIIDENDRFIDVNPSACQLYGYTHEEFIQLRKSAIFINEIKLRSTHANTIYPLLHKKKQGEIFPVEIAFNSWYWKEKTVFILSVRDVTSLREATTILQETESKYHQLFEAESDAIVIFDALSHQIVETNTAATNLYGYKRDEWRQMSINHILVEPQHSCTELKNAAQQQFHYVSLDWHKKRNGTQFPVEISTGKYDFKGRTLICAAMRDITDRRKIEEELRKAQTFSNTLIQASPVFFIALSPEGRIILINETMLKATEYALSEVQDKDFQNILVPDDYHYILEESWSELFNQCQDNLLVEMPVVTKSGHRLLVEWHGRAVLNADGKIAYIFAIGINIGERAETYHRLHLFETIIETSNEAISIGTPDGQYIYVNPKHQALFKHTAEQAYQKGYDDYCPPETLEIYAQEVLPTIIKGKTWEGVLTMVDAQGKPLALWSRIDAIRDERGNFLYDFALMHDVRLQQQLEEKLHYEHEQYEAIFNTAPFMIMYKDKENRVLRANPYSAHILSVAADKLTGRSLYDVVPEYADQYYRDDLEIIQSGKAKFGIVLSYPKGYLQVDKIPYRNAQGERIGIIMFGIDVTERIKTEQNLQKKEQNLLKLETRLRLAIESLPIIMAAIDDQWQFTLWNQECERTFGYSSVEMIGNPHAWELLYPNENNRQEILQTGKDMLNKYGGFRHWELTATCKDSSKKTIAWSMSNDVKLGRVFLWLLGQDVTEHEQVLLQLGENEERLRLLVQNMPAMLKAFNEKGRLIMWNRQCEKVTGYKANEMIHNEKALTVLYPDPKIREYREKCLQLDTNQWEIEVTCQDGTRRNIIWSNISKQFPIPGWYSWSIGEDVTAVKKMRQTVSDNDSLLFVVLDNLHIAAFITDGRGRFIYVNDDICQLLGYQAEQLVNHLFTKVIPTEYHNTILRNYFNFLATSIHGSARKEKYTALHQKGQTLDMQTTIYRVNQDSGNNYVVWIIY